MTKTTFELQLLKALTNRIAADGVEAVALRWPLTKWAHQPIDIIVDSEDIDYYLAIECKSIKRSNKNGLYFSGQFTQKAFSDQFIEEADYITRSGRRGFCAVEIWGSAGNTCHVIPWGDLWAIYAGGFPGLTPSQIAEYPGPERKNGGYFISSWDRLFK